MAFNTVDLTADSTEATHSFSQDGTIIIGLQVANTSDDSTVKVNIKLRGKYLLKNGIIPVGSSLSVLDGKLVVNTDDTISVQTDGASVDVIISYLEN